MLIIMNFNTNSNSHSVIIMPLDTFENMEHLETLKVIEVPHLFYSVG